MNLTTILSRAELESLQKGPFEPYKAFVKSKFNNDYNEEMARIMEEACKKADPEYRPLTPEEKERRRLQHEKAREIIPRITYDILSAGKDVPEGYDRSIHSLFYGVKDTPEGREKKSRILHIVREGTAEERHRLFIDVLNDMATFKLDEYRAMSVDRKLNGLSTLMPRLYRFMEAENLITQFKGMNCGVTPEEEKAFRTMYSVLKTDAMELFTDLDIILNPYYPALDLTQIKRDAGTRNAIEEEVQRAPGFNNDNSVTEYMVHCGTKTMNQSLRVTSEIYNTFCNKGVKLVFDNVQRCNSEGQLMLEDDNHMQYQKALKSGETLYFKNAAPGSAGEILAVHDVYGTGYPTAISLERAKELDRLRARKPVRMAPVKEPNPIVCFFDMINRLLGGKGFESVNRYQQYLQDRDSFDRRMNEYEAEYRDKIGQIRPETVKKGYTDDFNDASQVEIRNLKGKAVATCYMLRGKLTQEQIEWTKENLGALRNGFARIREDILAGVDGEPSEDQKEYLAAVDKRLQAITRALEPSKGKPENARSLTQKLMSEEGPERTASQEQIVPSAVKQLL